MVEIINLTGIDFDESFIKRIIHLVLENEKKEGKVIVNLVGPNRMRKLNRRFLNRNRVTDTLSFSELETKDEFPAPSEDEPLIGEIFICPRVVRKNAKRAGISFEKEFAHVLIHSTLHLLGYTHKKTDTEKDEMRRKEKEYLHLSGVN